MYDINQSYITGRTASKIITRKYDDIYKYSFITSVSYKSEKQNKFFSDYIPVCFWKRYPCKELKELKIGDGILIMGKVTTRTYESNDEKQWITEVQGRRFIRLHSKDMDRLIEILAADSDIIEKILLIEDSKLSESFKKKLFSTIDQEEEGEEDEAIEVETKKVKKKSKS